MLAARIQIAPARGPAARHGDRVGPGGEPADRRRQHAADARREEGEHEAGDDR